MEYAQIVFYQLVIFVIYGAIGVAAVKGGILDEAGLHAVSRVVIKVTLPVMLFTNTVSGVTRESLLESLPVTGATAVMYLLLALLCWGMSRAFGLRGDKASVFMASTMFGNVGFIGIPIIAMPVSYTHLPESPAPALEQPEPETPDGKEEQDHETE